MEDSQQGETRTESVSRRTRSRASLEISSPSRVSFSSPVVNVDCGEPASKRQRSKVWETMQKVTINNKEVAICRICESHLSAKSSNGTTHLRAHVNRCLAKKDNENSEGNQQFDQAKLRNDLAEMIILHEYHLSIVDHTGFRRYSFGLQPNFKMVSRNTIKKDILAIYDRERANAIDLIQRSGSRVAITTDMWTAKPTKRGFMAVTAHYIDKSWVLQSKLLRFVYVPAPHNQEVISDVLVDTLMEWGLDARLSTVTVDNATTNDVVMSSILEKLPTHSQMLDGKFVHMRCCAHILNLIVKEGLKVVEGGIRRIRDSCYYWSSSPSRKEKFEEMAKSMKVQCSRSLALDVKTRWNSTYFMLQSALPFREVFTRLKRGERGYDCLPTGEDWFLAHELLGKLKLFNTVTELFSGTKYITANSYFPKVCQIKVALTSWLDSPIEIVRAMASKMLEKYDKYWNECHDIMCIACVLDPRLKLKLVVHYYQKIYGDLADSYVERVKQNCRNLLHEYQEIQGNSSSGVGTSQPNLGWDLNEDDPLAEFDMLVESDYASAVINSSELDFYLEEKLSPRTPDFDVLAWWKVNGGKFPTLQRMARDILAIPVSTVASESIFSICGKVISQHRSRLHSTTVEALMCAQSWLWNEITDSTGCEGISFPPRVTDQEDDVEATTSP